MSPSLARVETLIVTMDQLRALYTQETTLIHSRDLPGLRAMAEVKHQLARSFEEAVRAVNLDTEGIAGLEDADRSRLQQAVESFRTASEANALAVKYATVTTEACMQAMVYAITKAKEMETGMTMPGRGGYGAVRVTTPFAFNEVA